MHMKTSPTEESHTDGVTLNPAPLRELAEEWGEAQQTYHWALRDDPNQKEPYTCLWAGKCVESREALFAAIAEVESDLEWLRKIEADHNLYCY